MLFVVVLALTLADRGWQMSRAWNSPVSDASWIWAVAPQEQAVPSAFYAMRDFDLPAQPTAARLWLLGDEEYVVSVNGRRIGSNRYRDGAPLDLYDPAPFLRAGSNRLHAEVRSTWGKGGLLACLQVRYREDDDFETVLVSDSSWHIVEQHQLGLVRGWLSLDPPPSRAESLGSASASVETVAEVRDSRPQLWGRPPTGRWGLPVASAEPSENFAAPPSSVREPAEIVPHPRLPNVVTLDWGEPVSGYVELDLHTDDLPWALLYFSLEPPSAEYRPADAELVAVHGAGQWRDTLPHRFRYLQVLGLSEIPAARVFRIEGVEPLPSEPLPSDPATSEPATSEPMMSETVDQGLFGLAVPPRLRPIPEYVARRIGREPGPVPADASP